MNSMLLRASSRVVFGLLLGLVSVGLLFPGNGRAQSPNDRAGEALVFPTYKPISGSVVDENGLPVVGALVWQMLDAGDRNPSQAPLESVQPVATDPLGRFTLPQMDPSSSRAWVKHPDYVKQFFGYAQLQGKVQLQRAETISGTVVDDRGQPIQGAKIYEWEPGGGRFGVAPEMVQTDSDGRFSLGGLSPGNQSESVFYLVAETSAGKFASRVFWKSSDFEERYFGGRYGDQIQVVGTDFEIQLPEPQPVELRLVDKKSGRPVSIDRAEYLGSRNPLRPAWIQDGLPVEKNRVRFGYLKPGENYFRVTPKPDSGVPPQLIKVTGSKETQSEVVQKTIETEQGIQVTGSVIDENTGAPIAGAAVVYIADDGGQLLESQGMPERFVRTDDLGQFQCLVPAIPARVRVVGECGVYRTPAFDNNVAIEAERNKQWPEFERTIEGRPGERLALAPIQLSRSQMVQGRVIDEAGLPVVNAEFLAESSRKPIYGKTDSNGRFQIDNWLTIAQPDSEIRRQLQRPPQIFFWHRERTLSRMMVFENEQDQALARPLEVQLRPARALLGRLIDQRTREPLVDEFVSFSPDIGGLSIAAQTDDDGIFLLEFVDGSSVTISPSGVLAMMYRKTIALDENGPLVQEIDDLEYLAYDAYGEPDNPPSMVSENIEQSIELLKQYVSQQMERVPESGPDYDWNSAEPGYAFKYKVAAGLGATIEAMLKRFPDSNQQALIMLGLFDALSENRASRRIPYSGATKLARSTLLKNLDDPLVRARIGEYKFNWLSTLDGLTILQHNRSPEALAMGLAEVDSSSFMRMGMLSADSTISDTVFNDYLTMIELALKVGFEQAPNQLIPTTSITPTRLRKTVPSKTTAREHVVKLKSQLESELQKPGLNAERAGKLQAVLDQFQ